jgi:hypothetical protein
MILMLAVNQGSCVSLGDFIDKLDRLVMSKSRRYKAC